MWKLVLGEFNWERSPSFPPQRQEASVETSLSKARRGLSWHHLLPHWLLAPQRLIDGLRYLNWGDVMSGGAARNRSSTTSWVWSNTKIPSWLSRVRWLPLLSFSVERATENREVNILGRMTNSPDLLRTFLVLEPKVPCAGSPLALELNSLYPGNPPSPKKPCSSLCLTLASQFPLL